MKLIDEWRSCHKFWSIRLQLAGVFLLGVLQGFPDAFIHIWAALPSDVTATFPPSAVKWIGYACLAAGIIARVIRQDRLHQSEGTDHAASLGLEGERGLPRDGA